MLHLFYGGTFDPVHNGHLAIARAARDELDTLVALTPAADPPHRAPPGANAAQRARMLELAIDGEVGLHVDRRELRRALRQPERRSYTVDTLRELRGELGARTPIAWLVGADSLVGLPTWHEWRDLFELAHFVVAERPGSPLDGELPVELAATIAGRWTTDAGDLRASPAGRIHRLHQPLQPESASDVRRRIAEGWPWEDLVPPAVSAYIADERLYFTSAAADGPV
ncbi:MULTISPECIES: nicotinate-nucleotide adenylyltransferase [Pseudoxanthomonas]|uniref:nicotinate-nucleotide adenylyltransferase n=1 Tax=Pseudoxanthomonas TaxID=83618 RepID=UPI00161735D4|nr:MULTISPECIES: nicotinate-nucleotide adenylyltransferase [Pseudoxanthomonas]MBB3277519.1 nicotinate-nucleotide adenylyltransferase [Pseudoxanthomonas sp. OG2]MBD9376288.1 nicotinate-nucleotide adenylyltransferase [Pseudoxanthomonas sp. PXM04]MBV7474191.1 nicotinate-nucleotide adenylyltransferase [Pseudoxanthomonas sp. PXM05]